jgi:hypothetical protein
MGDSRPEQDPNPEDFLRALLAVTPEDAAEVREVADVKAKPEAAATPSPDSD